MNFQLQAGYFSIKNPLRIIDQWLNPFHYKDSIDIRGKKMSIMYSKRAEIALQQRNKPLIAELQLYFTCVVQKRVNFHDAGDANTASLETIRANPQLEISYRTVQSNACDPVEFAKKHPVKNELHSKGANSMRPSLFKIDYKNGQWIGDFTF